jgi:hypothetical protein
MVGKKNQNVSEAYQDIALNFARSQNRVYFFGAAAIAIVIIALAYGAGKETGFSEGKKAGYSEGARSGWSRGVEAATEEAYWLGAIDACNTVFDATGWDYIYVNEYAGGGTISREYFCRDSGDHSGTPVLDLPYVENTDGSN